MLQLSLLNLLALQPERALILLPGQGDVRLYVRRNARVLGERVRLRLVPQDRVDRLGPLLALREVDQRERRAGRGLGREDDDVVRLLDVRELHVSEVHADERDAGAVRSALRDAVRRQAS